MKYLKRGFWIAIALGPIIFNSSHLPGCMPFFPTAVFTETQIPPFSDYVHGRLGVLQRTYWRKYLFIAFRYLSEQPLTEKEMALASHASGSSSDSPWYQESPEMKTWIEARNKIPGAPPMPDIQRYREDSGGDEWRYFENCPADAFKTATHTLQERIQSFGISHPGIKSWLQAQDLVFSNCAKGEAIPSAADSQLPQPFRYDRAYQIAAAHFYAEHYDTAVANFDAIAADGASPWSTMAPYLAVRCLVRKATVPQKYAQFDRNALQEAARRLNDIVKDPKKAALHKIAAQLAAFVDLRLNPLDRLRSIARKLERQTNGEQFRQDLIDYLFLMDHVSVFPALTPEGVSRSSEMTDWIFAFSSQKADYSGDEAYCVNRWKASRSAPWLLAALVKLSPNNPDAPLLLDAARQVPKASPAYATAQYHRIRLLMKSGKTSEARTLLDEFLPTLRSTLQNTSLNLFLEQRFKLARNFDEFLEFAPRIPQYIRTEIDGIPEAQDSSAPGTPLFDSDSLTALNAALPLSYLSRAGTSRLPLHLRKPLLCAVWMRAIFFSDNSAAAGISDALEHAFPELKADLKVWREAKDPDAKKFAAVMLMLHFPGMSPYISDGSTDRGGIAGIDSYRDNWWCKLDAGKMNEPAWRQYNPILDEESVASKPAEFAPFLSDSDRARFMIEWNQLIALPTAPNYFGKVAVAYANKHPEDARAPEALHLAVKSSRSGCTDWETGKYSRQAFKLLHEKYKNSPWTQKTPYWFR
jgi:hypothetical protein